MADHHDLVVHMRSVQQADHDLRDLGLLWRTIESSAAIGCPREAAPLLPTLADMRGRFEQLQRRLVSALADASRSRVGDELAAKAQCAIDILVRNLYERTADVGFLATDDVLRAFCRATTAERDASRPALRARLADYRSIYTVYDDVVLLAPHGQVLARIDDRARVDRVDAAWVAEAAARDGWHELHGPSVLAADGGTTLLYAHRVVDDAGCTTGILVLRFRLEDELRRIFGGMADVDGQVALVLVDASDRVIMSSDPAHVPLAAQLRPLACGCVSVTTFAGREYLAVQSTARPYQGYRGPAWRARAMVSMLTAFTGRTGREVADADEAADVAIALDDAGLMDLHTGADAINRELRRVLWNGQLMARRHVGDSLRLKAVLGEVDRAGRRTRERVAEGLRDLQRATLGRARAQSARLATLAADILDRNLYERANDCRWWALSPALRAALAEPAAPDNAARIGALLDRVNALYTVYSRLVVFDTAGRIRGLSRARGCAVGVGAAVPAVWTEAVSRLDRPDQHAVTPFEDTALHDAGPTLTYLAAVSAPDGSRLGGIALVFNARDELAAMLRDVIGDHAGLAAFVSPDGSLLASTDPGLAADAAGRIGGGDSVFDHRDLRHACSRLVGNGYREYRHGGLEAVVALRLGPAERRRTDVGGRSLLIGRVSSDDDRLELAVVQVGAGHHALPASAVVRALPRERLVKAPIGGGESLGLIEVDTTQGPRVVRVACARSVLGVNHPPRASDGVIVVLAGTDPQDPVLGLMVDEVLGITEVPRSAMQPSPLRRRDGHPVCGLVECAMTPTARDGRTGGAAMVQVVDPDWLHARLAPTRADAVAVLSD